MFVQVQVHRQKRPATQVHVTDPKRELAESLPLCLGNEDYLKDFQPLSSKYFILPDMVFYICVLRNINLNILYHFNFFLILCRRRHRRKSKGTSQI